MKNKSFYFVLLAALSIVLFGCPPKEAGTGGGDKTILVGEYGSLTGLQATFGQSTHQGIMLAVDEINGSGGVLGKTIAVKTEDDQSKQEEAANTVTKLISQDNVVAIIGEVASSNSLAAAPICQREKVPMISPSSTNPEVTKKGDYIFRMCYIDPYQGKAGADFAIDDVKAMKAAILRDVRSDYSLGLSQFFQQQFTKRGGQIVADQTYSNGDSDFRSQLTTIKAANPQIIYIPGYYNDVGQIAIQARDLGLTQPLLGGDGWESPKLFEIGGKALNGSFYSNHYHSDDPSPEVRSFVTKFEKKFGVKPDALAALGYDSMMVLADAIKRAGKVDRTAIRDAIASTSGYHAVTGIINMGPDRNPVDKKLVILKIENGGTTLAASVDPAKGQQAPTQTSTTGTAATTTTTGGAPAASSTATQTAPIPSSAATTTH